MTLAGACSFDVKLRALEVQDSIELTLEANSRLFHEATLQRMCGHLEVCHLTRHNFWRAVPMPACAVAGVSQPYARLVWQWTPLHGGSGTCKQPTCGPHVADHAP